MSSYKFVAKSDAEINADMLNLNTIEELLDYSDVSSVKGRSNRFTFSYPELLPVVRRLVQDSGKGELFTRHFEFCLYTQADLDRQAKEAEHKAAILEATKGIELTPTQRRLLGI